jgi:hypothetical protein
MSIIDLSRSHACRYGVPSVSQVDSLIFTRRYHAHCMRCDFCGDSCCGYGVEIDAANVERLLLHAPALERVTGFGVDRWFTGEWFDDPESPGGRSTSTSVVDGRCVFHNRAGRGCLIHSHCLAQGIDYHELKPMVSLLFPVTFGEGVLQASEEVEDATLACLHRGPTLYRGARDELLYYFGRGLVEDLDRVERRESFGTELSSGL